MDHKNKVIKKKPQIIIFNYFYIFYPIYLVIFIHRIQVDIPLAYRACSHSMLLQRFVEEPFANAIQMEEMAARVFALAVQIHIQMILAKCIWEKTCCDCCAPDICARCKFLISQAIKRNLLSSDSF
jgi:hypothetical protein